MGFDATTTMLITLATGGLMVEVVPAVVVVVVAVLSAMSLDEGDGELREWKTCFGRQQKKSKKSFQSASVVSVNRAGKKSPALRSASKPPTSWVSHFEWSETTQVPSPAVLPLQTQCRKEEEIQPLESQYVKVIPAELEEQLRQPICIQGFNWREPKDRSTPQGHSSAQIGCRTGPTGFGNMRCRQHAKVSKR